MNPQTVILAGGLGTRLRPLTNSRPKSMVELLGKPFLQHQIELLRGQGLRRFLLCVGHRADQIVSRFGDGTALEVDIKYSYDGASPLGTGGALVKALPLLDRWFLVLDGDSFLPIDFHALILQFQKQRPLALMAVYRNANRYVPSNVSIQRGWVNAYDRSRQGFVYIHAGLTIFDRQALERIPPDRFLLMDEVYQGLVAQRQLACFVLRRRFYEMGSFAGLAELERYISKAGHSAPLASQSHAL